MHVQFLRALSLTFQIVEEGNPGNMLDRSTVEIVQGETIEFTEQQEPSNGLPGFVNFVYADRGDVLEDVHEDDFVIEN